MQGNDYLHDLSQLRDQSSTIRRELIKIDERSKILIGCLKTEKASLSTNLAFY